MLIFGYFLSDKPDGKSVMHFNLNGHHVISAAPDDDDDVQYSEAAFSIHKGHHHKQRIIKHFSFKLTSSIPPIEAFYLPRLTTSYIYPLAENYYFLFCKEINPPPPKAC